MVERHRVLEHGTCFEVGLDTPSICQKDFYKAVHVRGPNEQVSVGAVPALAINFLGESVAFDMQNIDGVHVGNPLEVGVRKPNPCRERSSLRLRGIG